MDKELKYFDWEKGPAVLAPSGPESFKGLYIPMDESDWVVANALQVGDFFDNGIMLSNAEFDEKFGVIGKDLPSLPI